MRIEIINDKFNDITKVEKLSIEAFPPEEYLSPSRIIKLAKKEKIDFLAVYDVNMFVGFLVIRLHKNMAYLFFLAIDSSLRSSGYGSKVLSMLKERYKEYYFVLDLEIIDESAPNNEQRKSRKAFYIRNGYKETGQFLSYGGVHYEVLCMDDNFDAKLFKELMLSMEIDEFNPYFYIEY